MIENSSTDLVLLEAEVTVTVTREERHQRELARYTVPAGRERHVAVELGWCAIDAGKYRGQQAIEVRLDGYRVGELTYLMSQRYAPLVTQVAGQGGRPGCQAAVQRGARGLEVVLRLPRSGEAVVPVLQQRTPFLKRPMWIAAAVVVFVLIIASLANNDEETPSSDAASDRTTTARATPTTTTTTPPPTTTTTTTVAPAPPPVVVEPVETVTEEPAPPPPPAPEPEPAPGPACDPNYSGCVPVASDVDCAGGSGNGPAYVDGPVQVIGSDVYDLDRDGDGTACDS